MLCVVEQEGKDTLLSVLPPHPRVCSLEMDLLDSGALSDHAFTELASRLSLFLLYHSQAAVLKLFGFRVFLHT